MPPAQAAASLAAVKLARKDAWRREKLQALVARFRDGASRRGFDLLPSDTPIQPVLCGDDRRAVALASALEARGYWAAAIRPPTVPEGSARLRITFSAGQLARLNAVFPGGVCDWSMPGVAQQDPVSPQTYSAGPGGVPLPPAPTSTPV